MKFFKTLGSGILWTVMGAIALCGVFFSPDIQELFFLCFIGGIGWEVFKSHRSVGQVRLLGQQERQRIQSEYDLYATAVHTTAGSAEQLRAGNKSIERLKREITQALERKSILEFQLNGTEQTTQPRGEVVIFPAEQRRAAGGAIGELYED